MWSSHARALRKYVTFHLQDAGRCKAAASLPSSLREDDCLHLPSYKPVTWRSCYYSLLPHMDGGIWDWMFHSEGWIMTLVRLSELHLIFLEKMWIVLCGRLFCLWCNLMCSLNCNCVKGFIFISSTREAYDLLNTLIIHFWKTNSNYTVRGGSLKDTVSCPTCTPN